MFWHMLSFWLPAKEENDIERACRIAANANWKHTNRVSDELQAEGFDVLGAGMFGVVVDLGDKDSVIKFIKADDEGYRAFLDIAANYESDYLPEIFWTKELANGIMAVCLERLDRCDDFDEELNHVSEARNIACKIMSGFESLANSVDPELGETCLLLRQHYNGFNNLEDPIFMYNDLHSENVMVRGSHMVITDPWA